MIRSEILRRVGLIANRITTPTKIVTPDHLVDEMRFPNDNIYGGITKIGPPQERVQWKARETNDKGIMKEVDAIIAEVFEWANHQK